LEKPKLQIPEWFFLEASDRKRLEGMSSFCEMDQQLSSLSSDDRIQEHPFLTSKYAEGFTKLDSHMCSLLRSI
jgi:hypothetical protein